MALQQQKKSTPAPPPQRQRVSMRPSEFTQGGLIDDIDIEITNVGTGLWDYNGQQPEGPALCVEMTDGNGAVHQQWYSAGKPEDWSPTEDNTGFYSESGKTTINNQTNLGKFLASLVDNGFPDDLLADGDLTVLTGTKCHINQIAQERKGLVRSGKNADRPSTTLLVTKIHSLPGAEGTATATTTKASAGTKAAPGKASTAGTKSPAAKPNGSATPVAGNDMDSEIVAALMAALVEKGEPIVKKDMTKPVYAHFIGNDAIKPLATKAVARSNQAAFLSTLGQYGMVFSGTELSLAE